VCGAYGTVWKRASQIPGEEKGGITMRLLVIEDERALCETIVRSLRRLAYSVDYCYDGNRAMELLGEERYDLVLLDLNLPGADGMTVLKTLRQTDRETRVLILSARSEVADKVAGLDAGANDYLAKPFHLEELEARIRSLTLRQFTQNDVVLTCGGVTFDTKARTAAAAGPWGCPPSAPPRKKPGASAAPPLKRRWRPTLPSWTVASCPRPWTNTTACGMRRPPPFLTISAAPSSSSTRWAASGTPRRPPSSAAARS